MSDRIHETYLRIEEDPADDFLHGLRSRLGHLEHDDLTDSLLKVIVRIWRVDGCRMAVVEALEQLAGATHA